MDYKDDIQNEADKIATERYDEDFYDLPPSIRDAVYDEATSVVWDSYASLGDYPKDKAREESCRG